MKFDTDYFKKKSREHFDEAWQEGPGVIDIPGLRSRYPYYRYKRARSHPVFDTIGRLRETYLGLGFDEAMNPVFIEEADVYRQFGPEAMAVLDRVFYLGGLPRPNVGIARNQLDGIKNIIGRDIAPAFEEKLRETLHAYKKSEIDGDELVYEIASVLDTDDACVIRILDEIFPEFRDLAPESTRTTLRSHMTSGWFMTLGAIWERKSLPIRMFSIDRCFRREQEESPTRLMTYHSASCVVAGEGVTNEEGKAVSQALLSAFGFQDFKFRPDEKRSKYYIPDTQTEVYARHPLHGWVELATFGLYSPSALSEYGIGVPVMNLGLGVERIAMLDSGSEDVRELVHPQFFSRPLSDIELSGAIRPRTEPVTMEGMQLMQSIVNAASEFAAEPGPCSFEAWKGVIHGTELTVYIEETEEGTRLCGPAAFNMIYVHNGSVIGIPETDKFAEIMRDGISTGIRYIDSVSALASARIEDAAACQQVTSFQAKMAKFPSDINIMIDDYAMRHITDTNKKIDIRGPVFVAIRSEIS